MSNHLPPPPVWAQQRVAALVQRLRVLIQIGVLL